MATFDHFAVSAATLSEGVAHVAAVLGLQMGPGGKHDLMSTHNRLSGLGPGEYMEVIAIDPDAPPPGRPRWFDLDRRSGPPRIGNWIARVNDLDAVVARWPEAGQPLSFQRGPFRWRMAVPDDGILPFDGCFPALIQWESAAPSFDDVGLRLTGLELRHPEGAALAEVLADLIRDPRIQAATGPRRITAHLDTPDGPRTLS
ncbi:VOC family protein [Jannaschia seohaensis]|uniref:Glyoxalase-like domain-containing protein n=1 Tax=Jannaschia seohaensis TaxID=475081 RepID=A0A2Y9AAB8_9RHOB|nr:VOC family protein [Jannaschia seohaensis]PWJ21101.1 glyoxalase-like protein [Jannaschia seohaensis]SSA41511.1 Glyoxalase-like domain-containing protein [Jannaschia seohaensis]